MRKKMEKILYCPYWEGISFGFIETDVVPKSIRRPVAIILKYFMIVQHILGFIPIFLAINFIGFFRKPKNDREFYKRVSYIQSFVFPFIIAGFIIFILSLFSSPVIMYLLTFFVLFYLLYICCLQSEDYDYRNFGAKIEKGIEIIPDDSDEEIIRFENRLANIRLIVFLLTLIMFVFVSSGFNF